MRHEKERTEALQCELLSVWFMQIDMYILEHSVIANTKEITSHGVGVCLSVWWVVLPAQLQVILALSCN